MNKGYYISTNNLSVLEILSSDHTMFTERQAFMFGNIIKYLTRAGFKDIKTKQEDLNKALDYYNQLILEDSENYKYKMYVKERIRVACFSLGCIDNYRDFVCMIP